MSIQFNGGGPFSNLAMSPTNNTLKLLSGGLEINGGSITISDIPYSALDVLRLRERVGQYPRRLPEDQPKRRRLHQRRDVGFAAFQNSSQNSLTTLTATTPSSGQPQITDVEFAERLQPLRRRQLDDYLAKYQPFQRDGLRHSDRQGSVRGSTARGHDRAAWRRGRDRRSGPQRRQPAGCLRWWTTPAAPRSCDQRLRGSRDLDPQPHRRHGVFSGVIEDGASAFSLVDAAAAGVQILAGSNTYSGGTTISGGTLQIGNGGSGEYLASPTIGKQRRTGLQPRRHADLRRRDQRQRAVDGAGRRAC